MSDQLPDTKLDWEGLRKELEANGSIRNVSLMATMPLVEPPTIMTGTTPGIYPVREPMLYPIKGDDDLQITPENDIISGLPVKFDYSKIEIDLPGCKAAMEKYVEQLSDPSVHFFHEPQMTVERATAELEQVARKCWEEHHGPTMSVQEVQARVDAWLKTWVRKPAPAPIIIQLIATKKEES